MWLMLTLGLAAVVVVGLAGYLIAVALVLADARRQMTGMADALEAVARQTAPLEQQLVTINGAMSALAAGLEIADRRLDRAAAAFGV